MDRFPDWIVGFVDGEGTFAVSIFRNPSTRLGWQVFPEFVISQRARDAEVLRLVRDAFGCGHVYINKRCDDHHGNMAKYCVRRFSDLSRIIVPFFRAHPLRTSKMADFDKFGQVMEMIERGCHRDMAGLAAIADISQTMNRCCQRKCLA